MPKLITAARSIRPGHAIASRQLPALAAFQRAREKKLRLADVKQLFLQSDRS
jgi:hypothetical protein